MAADTLATTLPFRLTRYVATGDVPLVAAFQASEIDEVVTPVERRFVGALGATAAGAPAASNATSSM